MATTSYKLIPEPDLLRAIAALREAVAALNKLVEIDSGTVQMPKGSAAPPRTPERATGSLLDVATEAAKKVREIVNRVEKGGAPHRPKQFDKAGPKIADFVHVLMDKRGFTTVEAMEKIKKFVALKENKRKATGQVRSALANDTTRFKRASDGSWIKIAN